jgi:hypothetical protein
LATPRRFRYFFAGFLIACGYYTRILRKEKRILTNNFLTAIQRETDASRNNDFAVLVSDLALAVCQPVLAFPNGGILLQATKSVYGH